jgi:hypothetical protein
VLVEKILELMYALDIPNGLKAIGYTEDDIPSLVQGVWEKREEGDGGEGGEEMGQALFMGRTREKMILFLFEGRGRPRGKN